LELALRVDNVETVVPKPYPDTLQAQRLSAQTGPGPTCGERTTRNGGLELAKRATDPRVVLPQKDPSARKVPRSGPTSLPRNDEHPRLGPAPSRRPPGSQSDAAAARRRGAGGGRQSAGSALVTQTARHGHPAWQPSLLDHSSTTLIRRSRLSDSEKSPPSVSRRFRTQPWGSTDAWNLDSDGCRTQEARTQPRAPRGWGGATPGPDTIRLRPDAQG
jgi:hypothetical protein